MYELPEKKIGGESFGGGGRWKNLLCCLRFEVSCAVISFIATEKERRRGAERPA
jgi:hypothetical protein